MQNLHKFWAIVFWTPRNCCKGLTQTAKSGHCSCCARFDSDGYHRRSSFDPHRSIPLHSLLVPVIHANFTSRPWSPQQAALGTHFPVRCRSPDPRNHVDHVRRPVHGLDLGVLCLLRKNFPDYLQVREAYLHHQQDIGYQWVEANMHRRSLLCGMAPGAAAHSAAAAERAGAK